MADKKTAEKKSKDHHKDPTVNPLVSNQQINQHQSQSFRPSQNYRQQSSGVPRKGLGSRGK